MKRLLSWGLLLLLFTACSPVYNVTTTNQVSGIFDKGTTILLLTSQDGVSGSDVSTGSGVALSTKIQSLLLAKGCQVKMDRENYSIIDIDKASLTNYDYVLVPVLNLWEDNATAWSGKPDKLECNLLVYDKNKEIVTSAELKGQSPAAVIDENDPSELIEPLLQSFLKTMFK